MLPVRDIDWLVREAATLDHLTAGNFVLAVTAGFWADELAYRGIDPADRGGEFRRRLRELRAKLAGDTLSPAPYTLEGPPVWLAGERAHHAAGRRARPAIPGIPGHSGLSFSQSRGCGES